jgi:hypothetical protein
MKQSADEMIADLRAKGIDLTVKGCGVVTELEPPRATKKTEFVESRLERHPLRSAYDSEFWVQWTLPIEVVSEANSREDRRKASGRVSRQRIATIKGISHDWLLWGPLGNFVRQGGKLNATFTRLSHRGMDRSNLFRSFKHIEDAVCLVMGIDDGWPEWHMEVGHEASKLVGIRIRLEKT